MSEVPEKLQILRATTQMCVRKHKFPQDLAILDEIPCFITVMELSVQGKPRRLWGSAAWLEHKGQTLTEFTEVELSKSTQQWKSSFYQLGVDTEIGRRATDFENVLYPKDNKPRRFLHCCRPIWFEGFDRPSTLLAMFNADNSTMDPSTCGDPLNFHYEGNLCWKAYKFPDGLEVLNDVPIFTVLYDLRDAGRPRKLWGNSTWLNYVGQTLEEFQRYDFAADVPAAMREAMQQICQEVQVQRKVISFPHTVYASRDKTVNVMGVLRPLMIEGIEDPLVLCTYLPQDDLGRRQAEDAQIGYQDLIWDMSSAIFGSGQSTEEALVSEGACDGCAKWRQKCQNLQTELSKKSVEMEQSTGHANARIEQEVRLCCMIRDELCACQQTLQEMRADSNHAESRGDPTSFTVSLEPRPGGTGRLIQLASTRGDCEHKKDEVLKLQDEMDSLIALQDRAESEGLKHEIGELQETIARMEQDAAQSSQDFAQQLALLGRELDGERAGREQAERAVRVAEEARHRRSKNRLNPFEPLSPIHEQSEDRKELERLREELTKLQAEAAESERKYQAQLTEMQRQLGEGSCEREKAAHDAAEAQAKAAEGKTGADTLQCEALTAAVAGLRRELEGSMAECLRLSFEVARLETELAASAERCRAEARARRVAELDCASQMAAVAAKMAKVAAQAGEREEEAGRLEGLEATLQEQEREVQRLRDTIARLEGEASTWASEHAEALRQAEKATTALGDVQRELAEANKSVAATKEEAAAQSSSAQRAQQAASEAEDARAKAVTEREEAERLVEHREGQLQREIEGMQAAIGRMEEERARAAQEHAAAIAGVRSELEDARAGRAAAEDTARSREEERELMRLQQAWGGVVVAKQSVEWEAAGDARRLGRPLAADSPHEQQHTGGEGMLAARLGQIKSEESARGASVNARLGHRRESEKCAECAARETRLLAQEALDKARVETAQLSHTCSTLSDQVRFAMSVGAGSPDLYRSTPSMRWRGSDSPGAEHLSGLRSSARSVGVSDLRSEYEQHREEFLGHHRRAAVTSRDFDMSGVQQSSEWWQRADSDARTASSRSRSFPLSDELDVGTDGLLSSARATHAAPHAAIRSLDVVNQQPFAGVPASSLTSVLSRHRHSPL